MAWTSNAVQWAGDHPIATGAIIIGGGLVLLYATGAIGGGSANVEAVAGANLAAAYYEAEGVAAATGNALAIAQTQAQSETNIAKIFADMQQALGLAETAAAVDITKAQEAGATARIAAEADVAKFTQAHTTTRAQYAAEQARHAATIAGQTEQARITAAQQTSLWNTILTTIVPEQIRRSGNAQISFTPEGFLRTTQYRAAPNALRDAGYSDADIRRLFG